MTAPACTCSGGRSGSHARSCALALYALGHSAPASSAASQGAQGAQGALALDGLGRRDGKAPPSRHGTAERAVARGRTFRSRLERDVIARLWLEAEADKSRPTLVIREPVIDLFQLWTEGMGVPLKWKPDALVLRPRHIRALEPESASDPVRGVEGGTWCERWLDLWEAEVHEAKTKRGLESRDYVLRLAAFRAAWPRIPVYVWRRVKGQLVVEELGPLKGPGRASETRS